MGKKGKQSTKADHSGEGTNRLGQLAIFAFLAAPWVLLTVLPPSSFNKNLRDSPYSPTELWNEVSGVFRFERAVKNFDYLKEMDFYLIQFYMASSHILYFVIWTQPTSFYSFLKGFGEPYKVVANIAYIVKLLQFSSVFAYFYPEFLDISSYPENIANLGIFLTEQSFIKYIAFLQLGCLGQLLNFAVYNTLGEIGVYYGPKLGKNLPWITGFPYNVMSHAQYVGSVLTWVAVCMFAANDNNVDKGIYGLLGGITSFYAITAYVEDNY